MRYITLALIALCLTYPILAQNEVTHTLHVGDTLASLEAKYDTCREAIIFHNDLSLTGQFSAFYFLDAGTVLNIPPRAECDNLPQGLWHHVVQAGETAAQLFAKYRYPATLIYPDSDEPVQSIGFDTTLKPDTQLVIPNIEPFYMTTQELLIVDSQTQFESTERRLHVGDTLASLAKTYQTCSEVIIWENQLMLESESSIAYVLNEGDTLIIPPATACDELPTDEYTLTLDERMTQSTIIRQYQQYEGMYYGLNQPQEGLLQVGDQQILPDIEYMFAGNYDIVVIGDANDNPSTHIVQHGDTFQSLVVKYNTCVEAILYANSGVLEHPTPYDPAYKVKVGTELVIPSVSQCNFPPDPITVVVEEGDTLWGFSWQYYTTISAIIDASAASPESQIGEDNGDEFYKNPNHIEPGLKLVIPDGSRQYYLKYGERLLVYDDEDLIIQPASHLSVSEIATCYGINREDIYEINGLHNAQYMGGSLIIPDPQHDCILRELSNGYHLACYTQQLEELVPIGADDHIQPVVEDEGTYCYEIMGVYHFLFRGQRVIFHRSEVGVINSTLTLAQINFCFRHNRELLKDITWDKYDATILPPDDHFRVFALPEHITCNREMFDDFYVYQVGRFDTLSSIARAYGTHPDLIAQANNIDNPHQIYVGQYLQIPTPTIFHVMQGLGGLVAIIIGGFGLRYLLRRRQPKAKRKPKDMTA